MSGKRTNKRPGRPSLPASEQLSHVIQFRVNARQLVGITAQMEKTGHTNVNEFAREMVLNGEVVVTQSADASLTELQAAYLTEFGRQGVNLNQIAKKLNGMGFVSIPELKALIARINGLIDAITGR